MASFVSARDIEATKALKKQKKRSEREAILEKAKFNYQKKISQEEQGTGEKEWMAPGLVSRFSQNTSSRSNKVNKEKKKKKKSNTSKRSKKTKRRADCSDSSSNESDTGTWVEKSVDTSSTSKPAAKTNDGVIETAIQRDSWMTSPLEPSQTSLFAIEKKPVEHNSQNEIKSSIDNPGQHPREINPYWKDGGTGMPANEQGELTSSHQTGDGGHSWMLRAYKRALEEAETKEKTLEEIAIARWGSLDKLQSLLRAAGIDPSNPDKTPKSGRRNYLYAEPKRNPKLSCEIKQVRSNSSKIDSFLIPGEEKKIARAPHKSHNWYKQNLSQCEKKQTFSDTQYNCQSPEPTKPESTSVDTGNSEPEVTDGLLNALSAKIMKAEMLGEVDKVENLKKKLERLRVLKEHQQKPSPNKPENLIPLVSTDRFGRVRPIDMPNSDAVRKHGAPPAKKSKRRKYTDDGEGSSVQELMEQERKMSTRCTQFAIAGLASKFVSSSSKDDTIDEKQASKVAVSYDPRQNDSKEFMRAMVESKKLAETIENCKLCFGNINFKKNLLVAVGINVYLAVPAAQSLTDGHCLLIPMEHHSSLLLLDENVWDEIKVFQKGLTRMFNAHNCDVVFTESYLSAYKRSHAYLECIPVPKEESDMAPMYFKKAIMESESEWSLNRKLIDTKAKGVRGSLPVGLPYFFVEFGVDGGFAHIVEDQNSFPSFFAKEVIGGMLDLEPRLWLKSSLDSFENQKSKTLKLSEWWQPYDWTQKLD